jgi:Xaa-Pro dipeptidase
MYVSLVDAGTIEVLHELGLTILSSADMVSQFEAVLSDAQIASHYEAQGLIDEILAEGFRTIGNRVRADGQTNEYAMVEWLSNAMKRAGMTWENGPNVSVNANSSDSHYEPTAESSKPIREGDFVLIDIWGRLDRPGTCFYDITWTGVVGRSPSGKELGVFEVVRNGRDAAIQAIERAYAAGEPIEGWQADDAARAVIRNAGYGEYFTHRTGHNIAAELHGTGAHLDNLETHDTRLILPRTCFSVEPGVYLPEFGIRSEVNMITGPGKAVVTGRVQTEMVRI